MSDLEARYRHALATISIVVGRSPANDELMKFIRKVAREAMPDHPVWVWRLRNVKAGKIKGDMAEAVVEGSALDELMDL